MTTIPVPDALTFNEHLDAVAEDRHAAVSEALDLYHPDDEFGAVETLEAHDLLLNAPRHTLRAIVQEALIIDAVLEANGGELTPELEAQLDRVNAALTKKADGVRDYLVALETDATVLKQEEQRLATQRKAIEKRLDRFERYVLTLMQRMNTKELAGKFGAITRKLNPPAVEVVDAGLLPSQYRPETVVVNIDKAGIKKAITATKGNDVLYAIEKYEIVAFDVPHHVAEVDHGELGHAIEVIETDSGTVVRSWKRDDVIEWVVNPDADTQLRVTYRKVAARLTRNESLKW